MSKYGGPDRDILPFPARAPRPYILVGNPWEMKRETAHKISFYGSVVDGVWTPGQTINAVAYDSPIPGYKTKNCISLRLWDAEVAPKDFNLAAFNDGDYATSMAETNLAQTLCAVLYPGGDPLQSAPWGERGGRSGCSGVKIQDLGSRAQGHGLGVDDVGFRV